MADCRIPVTPKIREVLARPVRGQGGFQDLLRDIAKQAQGDTIVLGSEQVAEIRKKATSYGEGGFQDRLKILSEAIDRYSK